MKKSAKGFLAFLNLIGFLATVAVNALATLLPINGKETGELSDQYPNLFVPSGLTFSIWGVIYIARHFCNLPDSNCRKIRNRAKGDI